MITSVIGRAVVSCWQCWKGSGRAFVYEIWNPLPTTRVVDISSVIDLKKQAISHYVLPLTHCDYLSANIELAAYRGLYLSGKQNPTMQKLLSKPRKKRYLKACCKYC